MWHSALSGLFWFCLFTVRRSQAELRPQSELSSNCFNFPANNFDPTNSIRGAYGTTPYFPINVGDDAIDFTLYDVDGKPWSLAEALTDGLPVVMIWGMFTCPAWQGMGTTPPWEKCSYSDQYQLVESNKNRATFIHLYGAEPHPRLPDTNFDSGSWVVSSWSVRPQQLDYEARLQAAIGIRDVVHPAQAILPDYLPGNPYSDLIQPVWCSYALGARTVTIISAKGKVFYQHNWLQTDLVQEALDQYWLGWGNDS